MKTAKTLAKNVPKISVEIVEFNSIAFFNFLLLQHLLNVFLQS